MAEKLNKNPVCSGKDDARERLLDAAEKLFCLKGFNRTSVRELTAEARCNLAAVNYHFKSKEHLYVEMFRRQFEAMIRSRLEAIDYVMQLPQADLEGLLRILIEPPIRRIDEDPEHTQVMRLLVREVLNRQIDPKLIALELKEKLFDRLGEALKRLVPNLPAEKLMLIVWSVDGVLLHSFLFMEFYREAMPKLTLNELIEHLVRFSASAIRGYSKGYVSCSE
ncbi:MAG TPA: TetR family transcriptional regulator [Anaerohalosphaeraceae bacterium]|nr:TetR family transcriptional regulator [Anaerohalosphaeraceae bacterium]HPO69651.1 TetR family transcriptional regulator [Anaerohalosphaeraceae bacterium]HRS71815.1 TetR family transcriptional regulator [Anaerohalosphaeraceae bacterium]HRV20973.1 TetR family transcriptional regulator [Anaerohalosphaeraceae bacterium]